MRDFIFIIGASGVGKSTLSKGLFEHYQGAYAEMSMVPEFGVPDDVDPGVDSIQRIQLHNFEADMQ